MPLTVGGGVRTWTTCARSPCRRRQGVHQHRRRRASAFVAEAAERFGTQCVVVAIDARRG
jgi:cyclase